MAIGGALVLGALPRLTRGLRLRYTLIMGLGAAILAASRPYEGGATCAAAGAVLLGWLLGWRGPRLGIAAARFYLPMAALLALTAGGVGYYFFRVTGSPFRLPEVVQREPYGMAPIFLWQRAGPEQVYRYQELHDFYAGWEVKEVLPEILSAPGLIWNAMKKAIYAWMFFLGPALTVPLLFLPQIVRRDRRVRALVMIGGVVSIALAIDAWFYPHYAAPVLGVLYAMIVQGLRHLRVWRRRSGEGRALARAIPAVCAAC